MEKRAEKQAVVEAAVSVITDALQQHAISTGGQQPTQAPAATGAPDLAALLRSAAVHYESQSSGGASGTAPAHAPVPGSTEAKQQRLAMLRGEVAARKIAQEAAATAKAEEEARIIRAAEGILATRRAQEIAAEEGRTMRRSEEAVAEEAAAEKAAAEKAAAENMANILAARQAERVAAEEAAAEDDHAVELPAAEAAAAEAAAEKARRTENPDALVTGFGAEEAAADQDAIVAQAVDEELAALEAEMTEEQAELMEQQGDDGAKRARLS